ncbi:MAG: hypothetical protein HOO89_00095 [Ferruginibacter sp.]|nr:hypothetical protein [Ferruginibacter sp.]
MINKILFFIICTAIQQQATAQQKPLPNIVAKNINNKIILSWVNEFTSTITTLNIQRSYDSLRNFKTIGSVLSPQAKENGFIDANPPYNKMYYRIFIAFEGGNYIYTNTLRGVKDTTTFVKIIDSVVLETPAKPDVWRPSSNIFTSKENVVIVKLADAVSKKYTAKFYTENDTFIFEIKNIKEDYLILEKVNFGHTGLFKFQLFNNGELIESNKFYITKDGKKL